MGTLLLLALLEVRLLEELLKFFKLGTHSVPNPCYASVRGKLCIKY